MSTSTSELSTTPPLVFSAWTSTSCSSARASAWPRDVPVRTASASSSVSPRTTPSSGSSRPSAAPSSTEQRRPSVFPSPPPSSPTGGARPETLSGSQCAPPHHSAKDPHFMSNMNSSAGWFRVQTDRLGLLALLLPKRCKQTPSLCPSSFSHCLTLSYLAALSGSKRVCHFQGEQTRQTSFRGHICHYST